MVTCGSTMDKEKIRDCGRNEKKMDKKSRRSRTTYDFEAVQAVVLRPVLPGQANHFLPCTVLPLRVHAE